MRRWRNLCDQSVAGERTARLLFIARTSGLWKRSPVALKITAGNVIKADRKLGYRPVNSRGPSPHTHTHTHTHTLDVIRDIHRFHTSLIAIHNSYGSAELGRTQLTQVFQRKGLVPICRNSKRSTSTKTCRYC